ncbi:MAG: sulfite exporter TauE/SafE family protein [Rhodomicrobium sp.]
MDVSLVVVAVSGLFFAGVIKGATGIGYSSCALPFLVVSLGLKEAIVLVVAPAIASNVSVLFTTGRVGRSLKQFWPFYLATLPGIFCGVLLLTAADKRVPTQILGVVICAYAILALLRPSLALTPAAARRLRAPAGFLNGLLTGFTGSQVMPLMPYMLALHLEPALLVQAVNVAVVIATVFLGAGLWIMGEMSAPDLSLSILAAAPALLGVQLGNWARRHIPAPRFKSIVLAVLLTIGMSLTLRA